MISDGSVESLQPFLEQVRGAYPELKGTDAQLASLMAAAMAIVSPESPVAQEDAGILEIQLSHIAGLLEGDNEYPYEDEEDT